MQVQTTPIPGLLVLEPKVFKDARGYFLESYNEKTLKEAGIHERWVQDNQSCSQKGVVRGLHFQKPPFAQAKLVRILHGAALDFAVDIRKGSPTYGQYYSVLLTADNFRQFYIPAGFAHGFAALEDDTLFFYKCSNFYNKASEGSIRFDDPDLHIDWQVQNPLTSDKDREGSFLKDFDSPFTFSK
ncbi:MAG: dTDP-4-dehydrorhamnose 3,5-epimerase [Bacteroidales bacterium]|nr:dTDP-4-dehydrorhamnose 3,5-epimerase [Bacteroidales bacterium]